MALDDPSDSTPAPQEAEPPPRPRKLPFALDEQGDRLLFSYRPRGGLFVGCFLMFWLTGWTVGCVMLAGQAIREPTLEHIAFGVPFWAAWVFTFCFLVYMLTRRETLSLSPRGFEFRRRAIVTLTQRTVPLAELHRFETYRELKSGESPRWETGIELVSDGLPLRFAAELDDPQRTWLVYTLNQQLERCRLLLPPAVRAAERERAAERDRAAAAARMAPGDAGSREPLDPSPGERSATADFVSRAVTAPTSDEPTSPLAARGEEDHHARSRTFDRPLEPPSDCRFQREDDFDAVSIVDRGRWHLAAIGALLFFNAFWNGIVSVFLISLFSGKMNGFGEGRWGWWGGFLFLIPFEAIGLIMLGALVVALAEPLRRSCWRFTHRAFEVEHRWLGIGRTRRYPVDRLARVDVRREKQRLDGVRKSLRVEPSLHMKPPADYTLALIDRENNEVYAIDHLSQGEANWIRDIVVRERPHWLR